MTETNFDLKVPMPLLLSPDLRASAQELWMAVHLQTQLGNGHLLTPSLLASLTGLTYPTIRTSRAQLVSTGWLLPGSFAIPEDKLSLLRLADSQPQSVADIPSQLIVDPLFFTPAKIIYGVLQATPGYARKKGVFTYSQLSLMTRHTISTVKRAVGELSLAGWLEACQVNRQAPVKFTLCNPIKKAVAAVKRRISRAEHHGEAIAREYLSLIVDCSDYTDRAKPGFLVNPYTGEQLELDRYYYVHGVAFEFNGPQHYSPTRLYPKEVVAKQQARDYIKAGLCHEAGKKLVIIQAHDLSLQTMLQKVGNLLPLRNLRGHEHLIECLENEAEKYRKSPVVLEYSQS